MRILEGCEKVLKNVRYVPNLRRSLISLGTLDSIGFSLKIEKGEGGERCFNRNEGYLSNDLYSLIEATVTGCGVVVTTEDKSITT